MQTHYKVFLNDAVTARFSSMTMSERRRFSEKMRFLAAGIWEGGILVKKLSGQTGKVLFEARLSKGDRLLFTLGRYLDESAVYVWALVKHDDVDRAARVGIPDNAPFLDFPVDAEEEVDNLFLDNIPEPWLTQESIEDRVAFDYGPQKWKVLDETEWDRMLSEQKVEELDYHLFLSREQYCVLERDPPLLVSGTAGSGKTTIALYYLSRKEFLGTSRIFITYSSYLRDFAAKLHHSLVKGNPIEDRPPYPEFLTIEEIQRRFLPPNCPLSDPTKLVGLYEFKIIIAANPLARKFDPELLWEEIRAIIKGAMPPYSLKRLETLANRLAQGSLPIQNRQELAAELASFSRFSFGGKLDKIVASNSSFQDIEEFANALGSSSQEGEIRIVFKILEFLKKKKEFFNRPLLSLEEYLFLGEKRAPNFLYDRRELYTLALYYEKKLEEHGLYDEIDLAKQALLERKRSASPQVWNLVVCDEIQDMTDIHLEFLFDLCSNRDNVFFAGDERQTINPSGFRWEAVRSRFFESGAVVPELTRLSMNFRSSGSIVELGNALLDLKKTYVGAGKFEARESWKFLGKAPMVIENIEEKSILRIVRESGAERIILVRSSQEKQRLSKILGTELVFTIFEAKGLEFETVLLWRFVEDEKTDALWATMSEEGLGTTEEKLPHLRHELNLLYTAVARARSILTIYDGPKASAVWRAGRLASIVIKTSDTSMLAESWGKASTPDAWAKQAEIFFAHGYYKAAAECYHNAGKHNKEEEALALAAFEAKDYAKAAPRFERCGDFRRAALCYEKSGDLDKAIELYARLGDKTTKKRLSILLLEKEGSFAKAGNAWLKMGETRKALEDWERGAEYLRIAEYYKEAKDYSRSAKYYEKAGDIAKAVACYKKYHEYEKASELLLASGDYEAAINLFRKAKGNGNYLDFCKRSGRPEIIARGYLELGKNEDAIRLLKEYIAADPKGIESLSHEAEKLEKAKQYEKAAVIYASLDFHKKAAEEYARSMDYEHAAQEFSRSECHYDAAILFTNLKHVEEALVEWKAFIPENHDKRLKKISSIRDLQWELLARNPTQGKTYNQYMANELYSEASEALERGDFLNALAIFILFREKGPILDCLIGVGDDLLAIYVISMINNYAMWTDYRKRRREVSLEPLEAVKNISYQISSFDPIDKEAIPDVMGLFLLVKDILSFAERRMLEELRIHLYMPNTILGSFCSHSAKNLLSAGKDYLYILAVLKDYSTIYTEVMRWIETKESVVKMLSVGDYLDELSGTLGDDVLKVCASMVANNAIDKSLLENLVIDEFNWSFLSINSQLKEKVVSYLVDKYLTEEAADVLRLHGEGRRAAELLESRSLIKEAAKVYESIKDWDKALSLYESLGDKKSIARMYEHKGDLASAIRLWKKLGFPKQVKRLENKCKKFNIAISESDEGSSQLPFDF